MNKPWPSEPYKRNGVIQPDKWLIDYYDAKKERQRMIFPGTRAEGAGWGIIGPG